MPSRVVSLRNDPHPRNDPQIDPEMIPKELSNGKKTLDCGLLRATEVIFACVLLKLIYGADIMKT